MPSPDRQAEQPPTRRAALVRFTKAGAGVALGTLVSRCVILPCRVEADGKKPDVFPLSDGGRHYAGGFYDRYYGGYLEFYIYPEGYSVRRLLPVYDNLGREHTLGFPVSTEWEQEGEVTQAFRYGVISGTFDQAGNPVSHRLLPIFNKLSALGRDQWLFDQYGIPPINLDTQAKGSLITPPSDEAAALLAANPNIQSFLQNHPLKDHLGAPMAYQEGVLRLNNAVIRVDENGQATFQDAWDIIRQKTDGSIIPTEALLAELSERWHEHVFPFLEDPGPSRLPDNVLGSELFVSQTRKCLAMVADESPADFDFIKKYIYQIREVRVGGRVGISVYSRIFSADRIETELIDMPTLSGVKMYAGSIYHEATHSYLHDIGRKSDGIYGELAAVKAELAFIKRINYYWNDNHGQAKNLIKVINNIDDPSIQWWH